MIRVFCGHDVRELPGLHVFMHSVQKRTTQPVALTALTSKGLPEGSNAFTLSRFLVPALCGYQGRAIFCDASDMLMLDDVAQLDALFDDRFAVQVVKHPDYESAHVRKYVGTDMECLQSNYERKNWASVMLFNCAHEAWAPVDHAYLQTVRRLDVLQFRHIPDEAVGDLPPAWNVLVDEGQEESGAKLLHWTAGIPHFWHYRNARRAQDWFHEYREVSR